MTATRLFRIVWRINGALVLLAFLAAGGGMLLAAIDWGGHGRTREPDVAAPPGEKDAALVFGTVERVDGTAYVILPLRTVSDESSFSSGGSSETRNLLFYDASSGATRWLRPDHRTVVAAHELLHEDDDAKAPVRWIRYELEDAAAADGEASSSVAVSGPGGETPETVLRGLDEVLGYSDVRGGRVVVFFRQAGETLAAEIDLSARKVRNQTKLPRL